MNKPLLTHPLNQVAERLGDLEWTALDVAAKLNIVLATTLWETKPPIPIEVEREALRKLADWILSGQRRVENDDAS